MVAISNRGDAGEGAKLSDEVTEHLRSILTDHDVAHQLKDLLNRPEVVAQIRATAEGLPIPLRRTCSSLLTLLKPMTLIQSWSPTLETTPCQRRF